MTMAKSDQTWRVSRSHSAVIMAVAALIAGAPLAPAAAGNALPARTGIQASNDNCGKKCAGIVGPVDRRMMLNPRVAKQVPRQVPRPGNGVVGEMGKAP